MSKEERAASRARADALIAEGKHQSPCACYYHRLCQGATKDFIDVMVDGKYGFLKPGKPIYPEFQDHLHVVPDIQPLSNVRSMILGQDYGLTPAGVWVQQDRRDGQYQVIQEFVSEHLGAVNFGEQIARISKHDYPGVSMDGVGDPSGTTDSSTDERTPIDVVTAAGVVTRPAPTNDFTRRREAVAKLLTKLTMLGRPMLVISSQCKFLRKAMNGMYCFEKLKVSSDDRYREYPLKNEYSHVAEALQYAAVGAGEDLSILSNQSDSDEGDSDTIVVKLAGGGFRIIRPGRR